MNSASPSVSPSSLGQATTDGSLPFVSISFETVPNAAMVMATTSSTTSLPNAQQRQAICLAVQALLTLQSDIVINSSTTPEQASQARQQFLALMEQAQNQRMQAAQAQRVQPESPSPTAQSTSISPLYDLLAQRVKPKSKKERYQEKVAAATHFRNITSKQEKDDIKETVIDLMENKGFTKKQVCKHFLDKGIYIPSSTVILWYRKK